MTLVNKAIQARLRKIRPNPHIDYSLVEFKGQRERIKFVCKKHGEFYATLQAYLNGSTGCRGCKQSTADIDVDKRAAKFKRRAEKLHGMKYKYYLEDFVNYQTKIRIECSTHGIFKQTPRNHLSTNETLNRRGVGCPNCGTQLAVHKSKEKAFSSKDYKLGGKTIKVQGYEPQALDYIQTRLKVTARDIKVGRKVPVIQYYDNKQKRTRQYFPDFYIPAQNRIVEIKSTYTFELGFRELCLKRKAVIKAGYVFSLLVMDKDGNRIRVPEDWYLAKGPENYFS